MKNTDIEEVKKIIADSGNNFHCTVLDFLKEEGWTALISPYYNDNVSDKPREIDLIAEKAFEVKGTYGRSIGTVNIKLFIECKYILQKVVFWFHDKDLIKAEGLVEETTPIHINNVEAKKYHYLSNNDSVAKLFADGKKKKIENEIFYKALNQSLNAMVYYEDSESIIPTKGSGIKATINFPVIICNKFNDLYRVDIGSSDDPSMINDNFQLEVNYAYLDSSKKHTVEYFLIDIVDYNKLGAFMKVLQQDAEVIEPFLSFS